MPIVIQSRISQLEQDIINTTKALPASELTYYVTLLLAALKKEPKDRAMLDLYEHIADFARKIEVFYQEKSAVSLEALHDSLKKLR